MAATLNPLSTTAPPVSVLLGPAIPSVLVLAPVPDVETPAGKPHESVTIPPVGVTVKLGAIITLGNGTMLVSAGP